MFGNKFKGIIILLVFIYAGCKTVPFSSRKQMNNNAPPEYLTTHPSDQNRIDEAKKFLPDAEKYYYK